jgi:hypothetical protein
MTKKSANIIVKKRTSAIITTMNTALSQKLNAWGVYVPFTAGKGQDGSYYLK